MLLFPQAQKGFVALDFPSKLFLVCSFFQWLE